MTREKDKKNSAWFYYDRAYDWPTCIEWRLKERIANLHDDFGDEGFGKES